MKIAYLIHDLNVRSGGGRYASDLINGVRKAGHEVIILKEANDGQEGVVVLQRGLKIFRSARNIIPLIQDCDIVHALDGYPYAIIAAFANRTIKKKLVVTVQGSYSIAPLLRLKTWLLVRWAYRAADAIIAISRFTRRELLQRIALHTVRVINHGVDFSRFYHERLSTDEQFIMGVGAIKDRKGYDISISAFASIAHEFPLMKYIIVGTKDRGYFEGAADLVRKEGLEGRVVFLENISDEELVRLYRSALLFILTPMNLSEGHFEGFGLVYLEAAAAGLPVIGTTGNGGEDAISNGNNGFLVPQKDVVATADALRYILNDPVLRERMSAQSYAWAREHDLARVVGQYEEVYRSVLHPSSHAEY